MAPVADAMGFVDGEGAHFEALDELQKTRRQQSLRRDEDDEKRPSSNLLFRFGAVLLESCHYKVPPLDNRIRATHRLDRFINEISGDTTMSVRCANSGGTW